MQTSIGIKDIFSISFTCCLNFLPGCLFLLLFMLTEKDKKKSPQTPQARSDGGLLQEVRIKTFIVHTNHNLVQDENS